jgi:hypothetical protein
MNTPSKSPEEKGWKISIINKPSSIFFKRCGVFYVKKVLRSLLRIQRGPDVVLKSLVRGLESVRSEIEFNVNPSRKNLHKTVHVLSNPVALEWAIQQKRLGKIGKLIAGPNVSILPSSDNRVFDHPEIDLILLPSEWTKDAYIKESPAIAPKIRVWPSGVQIPTENSPALAKASSKEFYLIFKKTFSDEVYDKIAQILSLKDIPFKTLIYGTFKQPEYFALLERAKGMIYLQKAESQGIALQEAWARNVPTLVWDSKHYTYDNTDLTITGKVSAPYLSDASGMFFESLEEFDRKFTEFDSKIDTFTARDYCIKNLSDLASAQKYIEYIFQSTT